MRRGLAGVLLLLCLACESGPETKPAPALTEAQRELARLRGVERLHGARSAYESRRKAMEACILLAKLEERREQRLAAAERGLKYAEKMRGQRPEAVHGYYGQAILVGRRMKNERLPGLSGVTQIRDAALKASKLDAHYDHGGAFRVLGNLYAKAPAWPTSIGDEEEALFYYKESLRVAPDWPDNHLDLAEFLVEEGEVAKAREHLRRAEQLMVQGAREGRFSRLEERSFQADLETLKSRLES